MLFLVQTAELVQGLFLHHCSGSVQPQPAATCKYNSYFMYVCERDTELHLFAFFFIRQFNKIMILDTSTNKKYTFLVPVKRLVCKENHNFTVQSSVETIVGCIIIIYNDK